MIRLFYPIYLCVYAFHYRGVICKWVSIVYNNPTLNVPT